MFLNKILKFIEKYLPYSLKKIIKFFLNDIRNFIDWIREPLNIINEHKKKKLWLSKEKINNYRKTIKIYDTFLFFNELELLEIRLNILDQYVDYFVIVEATETFTGIPKKLYYDENKDLFKKWRHKIIHYIIKDTPKNEEDLKNKLKEKKLNDLEKKIIIDTLNSDNIPHGSQTQWLREFYQKENIKKALVDVKDNDFCFLSDLDEIWNPDIIIDYSKDCVFKFMQSCYIYFLNNRSNENWRGWTGTVATKYKNIRTGCLNYLRRRNKMKYTSLKNGGWHFTFQGGVDKIKKKIESYGHQEINTNKIKSQIENNILYNKDIRRRHIKFWIDNDNLPVYILKNKIKYKNLLKDKIS